MGEGGFKGSRGIRDVGEQKRGEELAELTEVLFFKQRLKKQVSPVPSLRSWPLRAFGVKRGSWVSNRNWVNTRSPTRGLLSVSGRE